MINLTIKMKSKKIISGLVGGMMIFSFLSPVITLANEDLLLRQKKDGLLVEKPALTTEKEGLRFCDKLLETENKINNDLASRQNIYKNKKNAQKLERGNKWDERNQKLEDKKNEINEKTEKRFDSLEKKLKNAEQKEAVVIFKEAIKTAIITRHETIKTAIEAYKTGVEEIITARKTSADEKIATYKSSVATANTEAKANCESGMSSIEARTTFMDALAIAKKQLHQDKESNEEIKEAIQSLIEIKKQAIRDAQETFKTTLEQAKAEFKSSIEKKIEDNNTNNDEN